MIKQAIYVRPSQLDNIRLRLTTEANDLDDVEMFYFPKTKGLKRLFGKGGYISCITSDTIGVFTRNIENESEVVDGFEKGQFLFIQNGKVMILPFIELNYKHETPSYIIFNADEDAEEFYDVLVNRKVGGMIELPKSIYTYIK